MSTDQDERFMKMALSLGSRGQGRVWPRPSVGCVLVQHGVVVGRGVTDPDTKQHGEIVALKQAGPAAQGATAYVSLEPCAHYGQTPPCADALVAAGVQRVVAALGDPNPKVNGQGFAKLRAAGIDVDVGLLEKAARESHAGFLKTIEHGLPFLTLKLASTLDGRIATASGESRWITAPLARRYVHALRARHDAVMIGAGTARADNPDLRVRDLGVSQQPVRVVLTRKLDVPLNSVLAQTAQETPLWLIHGEDADADLRTAWKGIGAHLIEIPGQRLRQLDPEKALRALAAAGITRVFCEGGGAWAASLIQAGLVDQLVHFNAGCMIGAEGRPMIGALGIDNLDQAQRFSLAEVKQIGPDTMAIWRAH